MVLQTFPFSADLCLRPYMLRDKAGGSMPVHQVISLACSVLWQSCCTCWLVPGSIKPACSDCEDALFDLPWTQLHPVPGTQAQALSTSRDKCYGNSSSAWDRDTTAPTQPESCCQVWIWLVEMISALVITEHELLCIDPTSLGPLLTTFSIYHCQRKKVFTFSISEDSKTLPVLQRLLIDINEVLLK